MKSLFALALALVTANAALAEDTRAVQATDTVRPGVQITCTYRDTTKEQIVKVNGLAVFLAAAGEARAIGGSREDATSKLQAAGFGTDKKPCIELRIDGPDMAAWSMSGNGTFAQHSAGGSAGSN